MLKASMSWMWAVNASDTPAMKALPISKGAQASAAHGEVAARRRRPQQHYGPGTRAYLSAGLPGADWWVAGRAVDRAEDAEVELDEVERLYNEHGMWDTAFG